MILKFFDKINLVGKDRPFVGMLCILGFSEASCFTVVLLYDIISKFPLNVGVGHLTLSLLILFLVWIVHYSINYNYEEIKNAAA